MDITSFLYDFNLAYEISRLATDPAYEDFRLSRYALYRNGRPLLDDDRLRVGKVRHESPLELVTAVAAVGGAVGAVWGVVQIIEKITNFPLNKEKLKLEIEKLKSQKPLRPLVVVEEKEVVIILRKREALPLLETVEKRLNASSVKIEQIEIRVTHQTRREESNEGET